MVNLHFSSIHTLDNQQAACEAGQPGGIVEHALPGMAEDFTVPSSACNRQALRQEDQQKPNGWIPPHPLQDALHPRLCPEATEQHCTYADGEEQGMDAGGVPVPLRRKGEGTGDEGEM